jgi:hypothetical protein
LFTHHPFAFHLFLVLLSEFPRPREDNGIGIHFGLALSQTSLDAFTQKMAELRVKWCLVAHGDEVQLQRAATVLSSVGILPISRWLCQIDQNILDFVRFVQVCKNLNLPAYIQIFNEPSASREWRDGLPKPKAFVARWCDHASRVADAGGFPGLQVLEAEELRAVLNELKTRGASKVVERMWFCPHAYGSNHPPDYPYDERNQHDFPGATLITDANSVLQFLEFAPVFKQELGFVPPFIVGEGGWQYGNAEDTRYPKIDDVVHARYHAALFEWFRSGRLSNGDPLPDYLFAFCPWILYGPEADAWFSSTTGVRQPTLDAVKAMSHFTRTFGSAASLPPPPIAPARKSLSHYVLFGADPANQWSSLILTRNYLTHFNVTFGFSVSDALAAERVTILGDQTMVDTDTEMALKRAGCRVERLLGDAYVIETILSDRLTRNAEFG